MRRKDQVLFLIETLKTPQSAFTERYRHVRSKQLNEELDYIEKVENMNTSDNDIRKINYI